MPRPYRKSKLQPGIILKIQNCPVTCKMNPRHLPGGWEEKAMEWVSDGVSSEEIARRLLEIGYRITGRAIRYHNRNHIRAFSDEIPTIKVKKSPEQDARERLNLIVAQGPGNNPGQPNIREWMQALDLQQRVGSRDPLLDFFEAVNVDFDEEDQRDQHMQAKASPEDIAAWQRVNEIRRLTPLHQTASEPTVELPETEAYPLAPEDPKAISSEPEREISDTFKELLDPAE